MTTLRKVLPFLLLAVVALWTFTSHQSPITPQVAYAQSVDCSFTFTFTGNATTNKVSNLSGNVPCVNWRVTFSVTGTLSSTVTFQTSPDGTTWTSVPNTVCSSSVQPPCVIQGANPMTGTQGMLYAASYGAYVRVITSGSSGTGTGTIRAYGAKGASASAGGIGAGGGSGTVTSVGFTGGIVTVNTPTTTPAFIIAGTSGGIPYFASAASWASSGVLGANRVVLGGGAGAAPTVTAADTTPTHALFATAGAPAFRAIAPGDLPSAAAVACPENPISMTATNTYTCTDNLGVATGKFLWCQDPNSTPVNAAVQVGWSGTTANTFTWTASTTETVNCYASTGGGGGGGGGSTFGAPYVTSDSSHYYGPVWLMTRPGVIGSWTWLNQGAAITDGTNSSLSIIAPASASDSMAGLYQAAPATPYSFMARMVTTQNIGSSNRAGVFFRESGTGKLIVFPIYGNTASPYGVGTFAVSLDKYTNATTYSGSSYLSNEPAPLDAHSHWFKLIDDGTNLKFQLCSDNLTIAHCQQYYSASRTDFMSGGPNQIGFYVNPINATYGVSATLLDWTLGSN